ncbi:MULTISPECIES: hypothetical protein [unclassified Leeuwenhoekiella]|uniref:hypothetical protein n=1 Tax=unclassified Leeuwenhoekiella TaxID=2615029 RepID=UPI000C63E60F|nr:MULTISPECIES: hypothetical protein [unclassified Leeuwenhoekiella]MAW96667.1 hypothetical protein [Leeuwenhoekiella sp.]MBA81556.1 hypothetical protein [Leeuwenhoekiella sp.]
METGINLSEIALLTTVANFDLYKKTRPYQPAGIRKIVIDGREGMYGLDSLLYTFEKLPLSGIKWLILADEDVLFLENKALVDIIKEMDSANYTVAGIRDGGTMPNRRHNPYVPNTFFCILDFQAISGIYYRKEIQEQQFINADEFREDLAGLKVGFDRTSLYEPYYRFFLWLKRKDHKFLFLEADLLHPDTDELATEVYGLNKKRILIHTWYARAYGRNEQQTKRIDAIIETYAPSLNSKPDEAEIYKDHFYKYKLGFRKLRRRVQTRIDKLF